MKNRSAEPGDRIKFIAYGEGKQEGLFSGYWDDGFPGQAGNSCGWIIKFDDGHETWYDIRDIENVEVVDEICNN